MRDRVGQRALQTTPCAGFGVSIKAPARGSSCCPRSKRLARRSAHGVYQGVLNLNQAAPQRSLSRTGRTIFCEASWGSTPKRPNRGCMTAGPARPH